MPPLSLQSQVAAAKDQLSCEVDAEITILQTQRAIYYGVRGVGARVWELLQEPRRVADLAETITQEYDVDAGRCVPDLLALLEQMRAEGLLEAVEP